MPAYDWKYTLADSDLPKVRGANTTGRRERRLPIDGPSADGVFALDSSEWKLKRLKLRWFFKEALRGFLPDEILRKKKHGFGLPFGPGRCDMRHCATWRTNRLKAWRREESFGPAFVGELLDKRLPEAPGYYGEMVWILMMLEQWLRAHEDVRASQLSQALAAKMPSPRLPASGHAATMNVPYVTT